MKRALRLQDDGRGRVVLFLSVRYALRCSPNLVRTETRERSYFNCLCFSDNAKLL